MPDQKLSHGVQDTGNPVLDSTINLVMATGGVTLETLRNIHTMVLELAAKEPGGLARRGKEGHLSRTE